MRDRALFLYMGIEQYSNTKGEGEEGEWKHGDSMSTDHSNLEAGGDAATAVLGMFGSVRETLHHSDNLG